MSGSNDDNTHSDRSGDDAGGVRQAVDRIDEAQQRHKPLAIPVAVIRKFAEDQSTNLASMIAFWAFFSLFPLFLVFVTLLGFLLPADVKGTVLEHVASMFPLVDSSAAHVAVTVSTERGARTGLLDPGDNHLFIAVPARSGTAAIWEMTFR